MEKEKDTNSSKKISFHSLLSYFSKKRDKKLSDSEENLDKPLDENENLKENSENKGSEKKDYIDSFKKNSDEKGQSKLSDLDELSDLNKLSNFADNLEKNSDSNSGNNNNEKSHKSFIEKLTEKIVELDEFEDDSNPKKENFFKKTIIKYYRFFRMKAQTAFSILFNKLPPSFREKLKEENNARILFLCIILIVFYLFNYSPFNNLQKQYVLLNQEQEKNTILKNKLVTVNKLLKDKQKINEESREKFEELKATFVFNRFNDSLSVSEYLQELVKKYNIQVNSIGETSLIKDDSSSSNSPTSSSPRGKSTPPPTDENFPVQGVAVKYDITGDFKDIEGFLVALEDGRVFVDSKNQPVDFTLFQDDKLKVGLDILAFLDMDKLREKSRNQPEFPKDDLSLKKLIFSKNGSENVRKNFQSAKIFKMNRGYYAILKSSDNKTFILKNEEIFEMNGAKYSAELDKDILRVTNLENDDTLELKNEIQGMKND